MSMVPLPLQCWLRRVDLSNAAASLDTVTVAFWQKVVTRTSSSSFWAFSPTAASGGRAARLITHGAAATFTGTRPVVVMVGSIRAWGGDYSKWNHFAFVKDDDALAIYVNGALLHSGTKAVDLPTDITRLAVGASIQSADQPGNQRCRGVY